MNQPLALEDFHYGYMLPAKLRAPTPPPPEEGEGAAPRQIAAHAWERDEHEHYIEEPWVSRRLFEVERFWQPILDPCCGIGNIVHSARQAGLQAYGGDVVERSWAEIGIVSFVADFLEREIGAPSIVMNPPFDRVQRFIEHACSLAIKVAAVFPTRRLNAAHWWLRELPLARVLYLTPRPSMPPGHVYRDLQEAGKRPSGGKQDFCWLIFERHHTGPWAGSWLHRDEGV